jgi:hypothetical protein
MSLKLLRTYLAEAVTEVLNESEIYVDENGYAYDDEGNRTYVGKAGGTGLYKASQFGNRYGGTRGGSQGGYHGVPRYTSQPAPPRGAPDGAQKAAVTALAAKMPWNNFVASIKRQLDNGGNLSPKQKAVIVQMLTKAGMTAEAALFA